MKLIEADVLVVGAGPAGIAACCRLVEAGRKVLWIDQQPRPGGQVWRAGLPPREAARLAAAEGLLLQRLGRHTVFAAESPRELLLHDLQNPTAPSLCVRAPQLLLALGARERFLPFPGWTLPGVHGAGGLQALIKNGWPIAGQRLVLAGSGPLLLAAADTARAAGADLALIAEQAPARALLAFAAGLPFPKLSQAAGLRWRLRGLPYRAGCWVTRAIHANGTQRLEAVELSDGKRQWQEPCDALGIGYGLLPNTELAELLGCKIEADAIAVDARLQTSLENVYAAGECTGIGGMDKAWIEGELAALQMLGAAADARLQGRHRAALAFAARLARHFALRPELLHLAEADTLICRCEDVSLGALRAQRGWREAKLQTRCGMGACQGRICGPIARQLLGWEEEARGRPRAPLQPLPVGALLLSRGCASDPTAAAPPP